MNIEIVNIKDRGISGKERIVLKSLSNIDIGYFIVFLTIKIDDKAFSSVPNQVFWFPDKQISKNDLIVLYTKPGVATEKTNLSGKKSHFFYWDLKEPVLSNLNKIAVVIEAISWIQSEQ